VPRIPLNKWQPTLVFRRTDTMRWIWELRAEDRHVLNRSNADFLTKRECVLDALRNGQSIEQSRY